MDSPFAGVGTAHELEGIVLQSLVLAPDEGRCSDGDCYCDVDYPCCSDNIPEPPCSDMSLDMRKKEINIKEVQQGQELLIFIMVNLIFGLITDIVFYPR